MLWPNEIKDKHVLAELYNKVFTKIADMRRMMYQALSSFHGGQFNQRFTNYAMNKIYATDNLLKHINVFKNSGLEKEIEPLLDSTWNIYKECIDRAFPEPLMYQWNFDYNKDDWKKILEIHTQHPDQTYDNLIENYLGQKSSQQDGNR